jgi:mRNA interferase HigB
MKFFVLVRESHVGIFNYLFFPNWDIIEMHIIKRLTLTQYWEKHPDVEDELEAWFFEVKHAHWHTTREVKARYSSADFLKDNRVVFNIKGNHYRLIVRINYDSGTVFILFIGTHAEYNKIDAE